MSSFVRFVSYLTPVVWGCGGFGAVLANAGALLKSKRVGLWDLGMTHDYKLALGASLLKRGDWLEAQRTLREASELM
eukprot:2890242-Amphidinium_carterae.1